MSSRFLLELDNKSMAMREFIIIIFFIIIYVGCPGQLTRTTTIPHGPLDTLQAQEQVRHHRSDRRAHRGSNPKRGQNKSHNSPQQLYPYIFFTISCRWLCGEQWSIIFLCTVIGTTQTMPFFFLFHVLSSKL